MKKFWAIFIFAVIGIVLFSSCKNKRKPGRTYMPDMAYSRAYETYASTEGLQKAGIRYNMKPVSGTIARGDFLQIYTLPNDSNGLRQSEAIRNPLKADSIDMPESERLYMINCGICHGGKLDGNGPLYNGGNGPYPAMPKSLISDEVKAMGDGRIFHVITYGKGQMGSYASQLDPVQRWMVVAYIRSKQGGGTDTTKNNTAAADTSVVAPTGR